LAKTSKPDAVVTIKLTLPQQYIKDFLREWDDLEQRLCENAGVDSCVIEIPDGVKTIEVL